MNNEIPEGLYVVKDGRIYFDAAFLIRGVASAAETAAREGFISPEEAGGALAIIEPIYEMWLRACEAEGIEI